MSESLPIYQVDAFTDRLFAGNPAAVVPLESWLPDALMQTIAAENNLAETAFFVPAGDGRWDLRWFTPTIEVPLCGHATLATAFVITECLGESAQTLTFGTRQAGDLPVTRNPDGIFSMRFPIRPKGPQRDVESVAAALGARPREVVEFVAQDDTSYLAVFETAAEVEALRPDMRALSSLPPRNVVATAPGAAGSGLDFVSRMFAPKAGIDEDPVTGSAHCSLVPYWAEVLGKTVFAARQVSERGGDLACRLEDEIVVISGKAVLYLTGTIRVPAGATV
ncbi:MAG: PhzF family phenazine biosynthesis protein [Fulvimarina manganoxydans]|uniref:PhzF family phenazine biosynthesis protein n=1 Tax=Fulvimarina manganoxydans TaxID=937218 RepID=UPI002355F70B|nr:PhzF family phenazine biosynthesis protein [Fulvimarina manganoxydans]MCK5934642.1 PhzF family phenazine biosynthesis protein [Fulvimarina manganoxydans]